MFVLIGECACTFLGEELFECVLVVARTVASKKSDHACNMSGAGAPSLLDLRREDGHVPTFSFLP